MQLFSLRVCIEETQRTETNGRKLEKKKPVTSDRGDEIPPQVTTACTGTSTSIGNNPPIRNCFLTRESPAESHTEM